VCKKRAKALFISLFSVVLKKRKKCFFRFEFIFEFLKNERDLKFHVSSCFWTEGKKRMMIFSGQTRAKKSAEKSFKKEDEETEKRRFS